MASGLLRRAIKNARFQHQFWFDTYHLNHHTIETQTVLFLHGYLGYFNRG
jgi:hypothetical protein